jgi:hypothetical protein
MWLDSWWFEIAKVAFLVFSSTAPIASSSYPIGQIKETKSGGSPCRADRFYGTSGERFIAQTPGLQTVA